MTTDGHQSIAAISTDEHHHPRNADLDITATCEQLDQNLSDVELEEMGPQQKPTYSRFVILLEPTMFLCALYIGAIFPVMDQYVRTRISNEFNLTDNYNNKSDILGSCSNNSNYYKDDEVNSEASLWTLYSTVASLLPGIVTLILLGSYSDKGGRKIAIIVPQVGALIRCINLLAVIYFDWPLYFIVIGAFLEGLSGGIYMTISAGFSYVADITSLEKRSFRITILDGCFGLGIMVSQVAAGYLIASLGYFYLFLILAIIILLDIVIVACFLPETVTRDQNAQFWSIGHFRTTFNLYCRDNGTGRRWKLLLSLAIVFFTCSVMYATFDIQTFYLLDVPFCMSSVLIGYFGAMLMLISAPFSMLMSKWTLSVFGDSGLLLIGAVSSTAYQAVVTFSTTTFLVFMGKFNSLLCTFG